VKPNLIIIGSQKCGTTSLHTYLNMHSEVAMSDIKELNFFSYPTTWQRGVNWYESQFDGVEKIRGEASPSYTMYPNFVDVPKRMQSVIPDAKLIYIVRDPIDRIVSHYLHQWYRNKVDGSFGDMFSDLTNKKIQHLINTSRYHLQLNQYLEYYDLSQILVLSLEDLKASPGETLGKVFRFLEIDDKVVPIECSKPLNVTQSKFRPTQVSRVLFSKHPFTRSLRKFLGKILSETTKSQLRTFVGKKQKKPDIDPAARERLVVLLRDDIARFRVLTGESFKAWSI
jgi:hypothetical protein